jgi:hypothetical protein
MPPPYTGGCQCGAIRYEITGEPTVVYACHCTECQRQSGSAFAMTLTVPAPKFRLTKGMPKRFDRQAESGRTVTGWFCAECGTRIFHSPGQLAQNCNVKPGTLDDTLWVMPTVHVWIKSAQPWVKIPDDAKKFDTQPADRTWLVSPRPD